MNPCSFIRHRGPTVSPVRFGVCAACALVVVDDELGSVFDDDLSWDRDQVADMRGLVQ